MNLVVDIGNSQVKLAWFEQGRLIESIRTEEGHWDDVITLIKGKSSENAIISSVSQNDDGIYSALKEMKVSVLLLDHKTPLPLEITYNTPETLGHDRIAAAAGARYVCPFCNVLIIDMGTAITIDFISSEGKFMGGNISPGLQTRFRSLNEFTARLPLVTKDSAFPAFGTDTRSAIAAGVQQGIIFELNGYISDFSKQYPACEFIITGGDAGFFVSKLNRSVFAIPDLVLKGLNYILDYNFAGSRP
ncbi:MAG TPA: type III pantothenate kinase [Bacteroidales bacterium]|jgi:type III pantothenate kinase|nr:type III pantothenate kinase [Bacteroidales bacterium]